jgi:hypothetical protein
MRECQENTPEWLQRVSASRWLLDETDKAGNLLAVVTRFKREVGHTPFLDSTHLRSLIAQGCEITQVHKALLLRPHLRIKPLFVRGTKKGGAMVYPLVARPLRAKISELIGDIPALAGP